MREEDRSEESVIQNIAPAPPVLMADATPTMFPTPRVPARARVRAFNGDIPSAEASFLSAQINFTG